VELLAISPDGTRVLVAHKDVSFALSDRGRFLAQGGLVGALGWLGLMPDGRRVIYVDPEPRVWDPDSNTATPLVLRDTVAPYAFVPGREQIVAARVDRPGAVALYELAGFTGIRYFQGRGSGIVALAASRARILAAGDDNLVRIWDLESGQALRTLAPVAPVKALAISPDSACAASLGSDGTVLFWDLAPGLNVWTVRVPRARSIAFTPGGDLLVAGSALRLLDAATGREEGRVELPEAITAFALFPDGNSLLVGTEKGRVFRVTLAPR
jgi:WD40 repeat protein